MNLGQVQSCLGLTQTALQSPVLVPDLDRVGRTPQLGRVAENVVPGRVVVAVVVGMAGRATGDDCCYHLIEKCSGKSLQESSNTLRSMTKYHQKLKSFTNALPRKTGLHIADVSATQMQCV